VLKVGKPCGGKEKKFQRQEEKSFPRGQPWTYPLCEALYGKVEGKSAESLCREIRRGGRKSENFLELHAVGPPKLRSTVAG